MRFSASSVFTAAVLATAALAVPVSREPTLAALEREVASLVPALRSAQPSTRLPTAATLVSVLEQAASDIANDADAAGDAVASLVGEMTVAVHDALGSAHADPLVQSIDKALERLVYMTSVRGHPADDADAFSPQQLVLQNAA
ncbi:hypothetical protein EXIGLDRAFT_754393 [Exidia glandulosa HHB12029]|uniref:Uncharacterized protein n=1 Tax=Exidia glandulosa HHB12029 TaxID=1314781 RepID=A0A165CYE0_EXIGL|nr:hypothetical protein EXIGLDRAFT_754393 [Exidia glandulosa HHB12029]